MTGRLIQSSLKTPPMLERLLKEARTHEVTEEELQEQRVSFAFGNAMEGSKLITKDTVRHSAKHIRLKP